METDNDENKGKGVLFPAQLLTRYYDSSFVRDRPTDRPNERTRERDEKGDERATKRTRSDRSEAEARPSSVASAPVTDKQVFVTNSCQA